MRIKEGYILRKIAGSDMVVPVGNNIADFNGIITLNESATFLWRHLQKGIELSDLVKTLAEEYKLSDEQAQEDTENFVARLQQATLLLEV
jgi:hypothetical protein